MICEVSGIRHQVSASGIRYQISGIQASLQVAPICSWNGKACGAVGGGRCADVTVAGTLIAMAAVNGGGFRVPMGLRTS